MKVNLLPLCTNFSTIQSTRVSSKGHSANTLAFSTIITTANLPVTHVYPGFHLKDKKNKFFCNMARHKVNFFPLPTLLPHFQISGVWNLEFFQIIWIVRLYPSNTIYMQGSESAQSSQSLLLKGKCEPWRIFISDQEFFLLTLSSFINLTPHLEITSEC